MNDLSLIKFKRILIGINIILTPVLTLLVSKYTHEWIPGWIYENDRVFLETTLQLAYSSIFLFLICGGVLFLKKKDDVKSVAFFIFYGTVISILVSFITLPALVMFLYFISG